MGFSYETGIFAKMKRHVGRALLEWKRTNILVVS